MTKLKCKNTRLKATLKKLCGEKAIGTNTSSFAAAGIRY